MPVIWFLLLLAGAKGFSEGINLGNLDLETTRGIVDIVSLSISIFLLVLATVALAWFLFYKKKYVIFDREKGIVSIPGPFWYKNLEVPFNDVFAVATRVNRLYGTGRALCLYRPDGFFVDVGVNNYDLSELRRDWVFYVWYMDKNRPLPPAPVFDSYRLHSNSNPALGKTI